MNRQESLLDSALYHARKAIQLEPNDYYNYESVGVLFSGYYMGLFEVAMPFYEKAIDINPLDPANRTTLAVCYYLTDQVEKGDREFQAAYDLAPNKLFLGAHFVMTWLIQKGRLDEAEKMRLAIIKKHPQSTYIGILARILIARGKTVEALKLIPNVKSNAEILCQLKRYDEALDAIKKFDKTRDSYLYLLHSQALEAIRKNPEFQAVLDQQRKLHETNLAKYRPLVAELLN
jgi:tetratricopeptide (TPR) repeat protein